MTHGTARRSRLATAWLGGCSGCHMSFLDLDELLLAVADRADVVFGPLTDVKTFPPDVDVTLVEGAVANTDNLALARAIRANSRVVVAFGDCAVTGNITALRNALGSPRALLQRVYVRRPDLGGVIPTDVVPTLLPQVQPLREVVHVDVHLPGCPPTPDQIAAVVFAALDAVDADVAPADVAAAVHERLAESPRFGN